MPNLALTAISANIQWTDSSGTATLYPTNLRFDNWIPDQDDVGPEEVAFGTGLIYKFIERTDYTATFEISAMPPTSVPTLQRLKTWLNKGGAVTINTMDQANNTYLCTKKPGFTIGPPRWDAKLLTYTLALGVRNVQQIPLQYLLTARLPNGAVITVTPSPISIGPNAGSTQQLTVAVTDPAGTTLQGLPISYASTDVTIATVTNTGLVTAVATGSCSIVVSVGGEAVLVPCAVNITNTATSMTVSPTSLTFNPGSTYVGTPVVGKSGVPTQTLTVTVFNGSGQAIPITAGMVKWVVTGTGITLTDNNNGTATILAVQGGTNGQIQISLPTYPAIMPINVNYTTQSGQPAVLIPSTSVLTFTGIGQTASVSVTCIDPYGVVVP